MLAIWAVFAGTMIILCVGAGIDDLISYLKGEY